MQAMTTTLVRHLNEQGYNYFSIITTRISSHVCCPLQEKGVLLLSLSVFVERRPLLSHKMVYPGCQKFFSCCLRQKLSGEATIVTSGRKKPSGHGSYKPHFHAILKQDSLPNRFLVGSVCLRNLTCLHVGQWCVKQHVMLSNWGMANFVSSVSITPVKRLTSVNSVYSVNNFCRVCNVNFDI